MTTYDVHECVLCVWSAVEITDLHDFKVFDCII